MKVARMNKERRKEGKRCYGLTSKSMHAGRVKIILIMEKL